MHRIRKYHTYKNLKKVLICLLTGFFTSVVWSQPLPVRLSYTVIIDTDCGTDDMRALSILLSRPEITIKAVLTSDGSLSPGDGVEKVSSLLNKFKRNVPVACGDVITGINPQWRDFNRNISWASQPGDNKTNLNASKYLVDELRSENEKIILICLGSLTNVARAMKEEATLSAKIERIIWYNDSVRPLKGFNYECDRESADFIVNSGVRVDVISNLDKDNAFFDLSLYNLCLTSKTGLAEALQYVFSQKPVLEKLQQNHFRLYDDLAVLYLTNPELFNININTDRLNVRYNTDYDVRQVREAYSDMISGNYVPDRNVVFNRFPVQREMFNYDVRPIIDSAIARYGYEEWKANVMTDEFHRHLGVFSIVGAKMGIRARELFGVGADQLEVTTYAGTQPPYSCLNDGIQVSTGATLGMGTIHIAGGRKTEPAAVFTYKDRSCRISLKKEYLAQVEADIKEGMMKFGLTDDGYWKLIRHNALKYWLEWDRNKIFDIVEISREN